VIPSLVSESGFRVKCPMILGRLAETASPREAKQQPRGLATDLPSEARIRCSSKGFQGEYLHPREAKQQPRGLETDLRSEARNFN
jgi:hypothetical protein